MFPAYRPVIVLLASLLSVFLLIALGALLKRVLLPADEAWAAIERVTYYVLFPALIIQTLAHASLSSVPVLPVAASLVGANLTLCAILLGVQGVLESRLGISGPSFTSVFQGAMRWNAFVAIAMAGNLYGKEGITLASIAVALLIPLLNVQSVWVLRRFGTGTSGSLLRGLVTNPFIIGTAIGLVLNLTGLTLPKGLDLTVDALGRAALAVGLLLVGAGLRLNDIRKPGAALVIGVFVRLLVLPVIGSAIALALGLSGPAMAVVVICLGVPSASASYILARQMGGDAPLMAAILTAQTVVSALTLPLLLILFAG